MAENDKKPNGASRGTVTPLGVSELPPDFLELVAGMSPDNVKVIKGRVDLLAETAAQAGRDVAFDEVKFNSIEPKLAVQEGTPDFDDPNNYRVYRSPGFGEDGTHYSNVRVGDVVKRPGSEILHKITRDRGTGKLKWASLEDVKPLGKMPFERHVHPVDPETGEIDTSKEIVLPYEDDAFQVDWSYNEHEFHHNGKFFKVTNDPDALAAYRRENPNPIEGTGYNIADVCLKLYEQGALKSGYTRFVEIESTDGTSADLLFFIRSSLIGGRWVPSTYRDGPLYHSPYKTKDDHVIPGNHFRHTHKRSQGGGIGQTIPADHGTFSWDTEKLFKDGQWAIPTRGDKISAVTTIRGMVLGHGIPGNLIKRELAKRDGADKVIDEPGGLWDACLLVVYDTVARMKRALGMHGKLKMFLNEDGVVEFGYIPPEKRDDYYNDPRELRDLGTRIIGTGSADELEEAGRRAAEKYMADTRKLLKKYAGIVEFDLDKYLEGYREHVKIRIHEVDGKKYCEIDKSEFERVEHLYKRARVKDSLIGRHILRPGLQELLDESVKNTSGLSGPEYTAIPVLANPLCLMARAVAQLYNRRKLAEERGRALQGKHVRTVEEVVTHGLDHDRFGGEGIEDVMGAIGLQPLTHGIPRFIGSLSEDGDVGNVGKKIAGGFRRWISDISYGLSGTLAGLMAGGVISASGIGKGEQHLGNAILGLGVATGLSIVNAKHRTIGAPDEEAGKTKKFMSAVGKWLLPTVSGVTVMGMGLVASPAVEAVILGAVGGFAFGLNNVQLGSSTKYIGPEREDQDDQTRAYRKLVKIAEHPTALGMKFLGLSAVRQMDGVGIKYNLETLDSQSTARITALSVLGVAAGLVATIASLRSDSGLVNWMGTAAGVVATVKSAFTGFKKLWGVGAFRDDLFETERSWAFNPKKFLFAIEELKQSFQRVGESTAKLFSRNTEGGPFSWLR